MAITKRQYLDRLMDLRLIADQSRSGMRRDGNMVNVAYDELQDVICRHYTSAQIDDLHEDASINGEIEGALSKYAEAVRSPSEAMQKRQSGRMQRA